MKNPFKRFFGGEEQTQDLSILTPEQLLTKYKEAQQNYESATWYYNFARNPSRHIRDRFPGIEDSPIRDQMIKEHDKKTGEVITAFPAGKGGGNP